MKKLLLIPILLLLLISFASADVVETIYFKDTEGNDLTNVNYLIYTCLDSSCSQVKIPDFTNGKNYGNSNNYGPENDAEIVYPTNLETQYGYALYFYKLGYLPMEYFSTYHGNGYKEATIIFQKKAQCSAPIDHIKVLNDVRPNIPLVIGISASLDADTYSAFHSTSNTPAYVPEQYKDFYSALTKVTLEIYKDSELVYTDFKIINLFMDSSESVEFTWTPTQEDDYFAKISTKVIDNKCSSSKINEDTAYYYVHEDVPSNACYTLINRPGTSNPIDPEVGELITISGDKESYYIDEYQNIEPVNSEVTLIVIHNSKGKVHEETKDIFSFTWTPTEPGDYTIRVDGIATDPKCNGIDNYPSQILTIPLTVYPKTTPVEPILELKFIPNQVVNEGQTLSFNVMPYNYKGVDKLTFTVENLPEGATFEPIWVQTWLGSEIIGHKFTWTPDYDTVSHQTSFIETIKRFITKYFTDGKECRDDGKCEFRVTFKASAGNLNDQQKVIISVRDVNRAPHIFNWLGPYIITEGDLLKVKPSESFSDLDYDKLTYTYTAPLDQNGEWQTKIGDAGEYMSTITASDGIAQAKQDILIVVRPLQITENHAPVFTLIDDITAYVGEEIEFTIEAFDQDNDSLIYSAIELPIGSILLNQEFSWTPTQKGDYEAKFRVEDPHGAYDELTVKIEVKEIIPGIYLTLNEIPSQEIMLGQSIQPIHVSAQYNGEQELIFSVENLPEGASFEDLIFTWTPKTTGTFNIIFKVTDGTLTDTETAVIKVTEEPSEIRATKHNIGVQRIIINNLEKVEQGKYFLVVIYAKNYAGLTEKNIRITASLPELNQIQYSKSFDLKPKQTKLETMLFRIPVNTDIKEYVLAVTVSNNKDKETKYVSIMVE